MKFHIKSSLTFLLITIILLVGLTAISAADVDNTQTQEIVKHTEVSTTSYEPVSKDVQAETVKTDNNLNEEEKTIEKVNNTKTNTNTITKSPAIQSSNVAVKRTPTDNNPNYIYVSPSGWGPNKDGIGQGDNPYTYFFSNTPYGPISGSELGTLRYPTTLNYAQKLVTNTRNVIYIITDNGADEAIIHAENNALWASDQYTSFAPYGDNFNPSASLTINGAKSYTIRGEEGKHIIWSGQNGAADTNMLSIEPEFSIIVENIEFKYGNASGQHYPDGDTATRGGAIDNRGNLTVINCTFTNCESLNYGGAIATYPGRAPSTSDPGNGNAVQTPPGTVIIRDCTFNNIKVTSTGDDDALFGGAIWSDGSAVTIKDTEFKNIEGDYGAVISNRNGTITLDNVTIDTAVANTEGGAIINQKQGTVNIKDSTLTNLQATDYGGAVANIGGTVSLDNVTISHVVITKAEDNTDFGGTIYTSNDGITTVSNSRLNDMEAYNGVVFNIESGTLTVSYTNVSNAYVSEWGGLVLNQMGEVIFDYNNVDNVRAYEATDGPAGNGALFFNFYGDNTVTNSNFTNNRGRAGTIVGSFDGTVYFEGNRFIDNEATGNIRIPFRNRNFLIEPLAEGVEFVNNYFENNTNNYWDMLSGDWESGHTNPVMRGNIYIDNTLDHNISFMINGEKKTFTNVSEIPLIGTNNPVPIINVTLNDTDGPTNTTEVVFDLRAVYADLVDEGGVKNGTIKIYVGDELICGEDDNVKNSKATLTIPVDKFTTYNTTATLKYTSDKHFLNKTYLFTVYKITNTTTEVNCADVPIDNPVTVTGTVIDYENVGANGSVIIRFDDPDNETYFTGTVTEGEYSVVTNPNLVLGEHTVYVEYTGLTDRFNASKNYTKFNVIKRSVILNLNDIDDVTVRDDAVITGTVVDEALNTPITTGPVNIKITDKDGKVFNDRVNLEDVVDADGMFTYEYNADLSGHYDVEVQYLGTDDKYEKSDVEEKGFNANKIPTTTTLDDFEVITVGDSIVVKGTLTETESAAIPGAKLNITVPGLDEPIEVTTDEEGKFTTNGVAEIKIENTTMNKITATYAGNDTYVGSSDVKDLTVQEAPTNITINTGDEITAHVPTTATFTLYDVNGNIAPNGINDAEVTVTIVDEYGNNLNTTTVTTGPDGSITVGYTPVTDGEITYTAVYNGKTYVFKDCQNETKRDDVQSIKTDLNVSAVDTRINGTSDITVNLTDANGYPVNNGTIKLHFSDGTPDMKFTIPNGNTESTFPFEFTNTTVGKDVTVTATFVPEEHSGYDPIENTDDFNVAKLDTNITIDVSDVVAHQENNVTLTLVNVNDTKVIPGEELSVVIEDEFGNVLFNSTVDGPVTTGPDGSVNVPFVPVTDGKINITVNFAETDEYLSSANRSADVEVANIKTDLNVSAVDTRINGTSDITVNLTDANGYPVNNGTIVLHFSDGTPDMKFTIPNGNTESTFPFEFTNTTVGKDVTVTAEFVPDEHSGYDSATGDDEFNVAKLNTSVELEFGDVVAHNTSNVTITLNNINDTVTVPGEKFNVTITDELGNVLFEGPVDVPTDADGRVNVTFVPVTDTPVTVVAEFAETDVYLESSNKDNTEVGTMPTSLNVTIEDTVINGTTTVVVDLADENGNPVNGTIQFVCDDGTVLEAVTVNGTTTHFEVPFNNTHVGKNVTVTANFVPAENSGYDSDDDSDDFEVGKLPTSIEIDSGNPVAHNETIATITLKNSTANVPNELINITIVDKEGNVLFNDTVNTTDGIVEVPYTPVTGSPINITVVFDGNPEENVYIGSDNSIEVTPAMMETTLVLNSTNTIVDGTSTIGVNVTDANGNPVNGTVDLTIKDDKGNEYNVSVPVENGIGNYTYPAENADMGKIVDVTGHYVENETLGYAASPEADTEFEVAKLNTTVDLVVNNVTVTNFTVNITVTGKDTDRTVEDGPVTIYANGTKVGEAEIVDGKAENVWLNITEIGDYELTVEYDGNDVFNENDTFATDVTAIKINTTTTVEVVNNTVGNVTLEAVVLDVNGNIVNEGVVNITATDEEGNEYYIGDAEIVDGKAIIKNETLTGNEEYVFTANFEGTPTYNISNGTTTEEIVTRPTTTTIEVLNNTLGNVTVQVTVVDNETGNPIPYGDVEITLPNGTVITVKTDENGENITTFDDIPVGEDKEFDANYLGNDTYSPSEDDTVTDVLPRPSEITGEVINNTARNVTINATVVDAETKQPVPNGPVVAKLNGTVIGEGIVENGTAIIPTNLDKIGNYIVELEYLGNENYTESNNTVPVEVVGRIANITGEPGNTTLGNSTVIVNLTDDETGEPLVNATVIITLPDGSEVNGTITPDGTVEIPVDLPVGNHTLPVRYEGNETYNATNTTVDIEILPRPSEITGEVINNTAKNVTINATVLDAETKQPVPNGPVVAKVNGTVVGTGEVINGTAIIPTDLDKIGNYDVELEYLGNENYTESNTTVPVDVVGRPSDITAVPGNETLGNSTVNITLVDPETNEPIPFAPVIITLPNGTEVPAVTDENGTVEVPVDLPVGPHTLNVTYPGNETYSPSNTTVDMNILPRPSEIEAELINNTAGNVTIKATVTDAETGELVPNGPVEVYVNGTLVGTGEVVDGIAIIKTNITEIGNYDFDVEYLGNENYTESNTTVNDDVVGRPSDITAEPGREELGNSTVNITLVDPETNEPIPNAPVIITLPDGTNVTGTTDENGFVEVPVDLSAGNHTLVVTYPGNETYSPSNTTVDMEILPLPTVIEPEVINPVIGEKEIELVLKDPETGDLLANKPVVITLPDGSTINATTDENGKVRTPVDLPAGENELIISFAGDDKYSPSTAPLVVDVVKRNATLTPTVRENVNGTAVVDILAVDDLTGKPVVNGTIELTLADGTKVTAITDENGIATYTGVNVPVGETVYDAKLIENPIYNKAVTDVTIDNVPRMINIGNWTLIRVNVPVDNGTDDVVPGEPDTVKPVPRNKGKVAPRVRSVNKYQQRTSKYNRYNRYSRYTSRYNKRPSWNRPSRGIPVPVPAMTKEQYILFITLYGELLEGDISFSDFMVVLKLNGIEIASTNAWDENGQITLTYDDISEVPDSIEIQDNSGHFSDYNSDIEKDNAPSSSGEIDSGDINVEQKSSSSSASKASDSVSNTASESASAAEA